MEKQDIGKTNFYVPGFVSFVRFIKLVVQKMYNDFGEQFVNLVTFKWDILYSLAFPLLYTCLRETLTWVPK